MEKKGSDKLNELSEGEREREIEEDNAYINAQNNKDEQENIEREKKRSPKEDTWKWEKGKKNIKLWIYVTTQMLQTKKNAY